MGNYSMSTLSLNHKEALQSAYKHTQFVTVLPSTHTGTADGGDMAGACLSQEQERLAQDHCIPLLTTIDHY